MAEEDDLREQAMLFFRRDKAYRKWQPLRRTWELEGKRLPDFPYADLPHVDLRNCDLSRLSFFGANLSHATLSGADFTGTDLRGANLRGANLDGCVLAKCDRRKAQVNRATYERSNWNAVNWKDWYSAGASFDPDLAALMGDGLAVSDGSTEAPRPDVRVFLSYRRTPVPSKFARDLFRHLSARLGHDGVFLDDEHIDFGEDFVAHIRQRMGGYHVLVALIDKKWMVDPRDGRLRSRQKIDHVRLELETALAAEIHVLPVLLEGVRMPRAEELPASIARIATFRALPLSSKEFDASADALLDACARLHCGKADYG